MSHESPAPEGSIERAIRSLVDSLPEAVVRGIGSNEEGSEQLRSLQLPKDLESVMLHQWPRIVRIPRQMLRGRRAAEEFAWSLEADVRSFQTWYAREIQMLEVASCLNGDLVAVDYSEETYPVYLVEMVTLVDGDRREDQPFCIRLADSLSEFVEWAAADGSWERRSMGALDYHALIDLGDDRFPSPESRPAARRLHPDAS